MSIYIDFCKYLSAIHDIINPWQANRKQRTDVLEVLVVVLVALEVVVEVGPPKQVTTLEQLKYPLILLLERTLRGRLHS
jgi:hypothetical protein